MPILLGVSLLQMLDPRRSDSTVSSDDGSSSATAGSSAVVASSATAGSSAAVASSAAVTGSSTAAPSSAAGPFSPYSDTCLQCCVMLTGFHYNELCGVALLA